MSVFFILYPCFQLQVIFMSISFMSLLSVVCDFYVHFIYVLAFSCKSDFYVRFIYVLAFSCKSDFYVRLFILCPYFRL